MIFSLPSLTFFRFRLSDISFLIYRTSPEMENATTNFWRLNYARRTIFNLVSCVHVDPIYLRKIQKIPCTKEVRLLPPPRKAREPLDGKAWDKLHQTVVSCQQTVLLITNAKKSGCTMQTTTNEFSECIGIPQQLLTRLWIMESIPQNSRESVSHSLEEVAGPPQSSGLNNIYFVTRRKMGARIVYGKATENERSGSLFSIKETL
uniref:Uncharacterized protein n=1 Tax=Romanomermis culicivorax TaxID=13658 RepID=A0A915J4G1_ROMCU